MPSQPSSLSTPSSVPVHENLVQSIFDYAIYSIDLDGRIMSWNPGAQRIKGYTAEEIIGQHFSVLFTEADRRAGRPELALAIALKSGRFEDEGWRLRKDGSHFWALAVLEAVRDENGKTIAFAKITRDMTERRQAKQALIEDMRLFRLLVEGVTDYAIFMLDPGGWIINWNTGAERIKGYRAAEIVGQHFSKFYVDEDRANGLPVRALQTARDTGHYEAEGWRVRKDGSHFWASVVIDAVHDDEGRLIGFAKITRDVTERKEAQERLEEAREQLFQSQKMEAIGQLTGGIAHDFNNLLMAILGAVQLARRQAGDNEKLLGLLDHVRTAAQHGGTITKQLLAFARRQPLTPIVIDLNEQLPFAANLLRHALRSEVGFVTEFPDNLWRIEADASQLELALLNLARNASDAISGDGTVRLSASNVLLKGEVEGLSGEYVAISIGDTGSGIPPEIKDRIFEPFFTTKDVGQGTGLGLSQVYGFAKQSHGGLMVESEIGRGTMVTMYLPRGSRDAGDRVSDQRRVLLVEDDKDLAQLSAMSLREMGYLVESVHNADEALAMLRQDPHFDLLFTDVVMPGKSSGLDLARQVRISQPRLPILLTTGYSHSIAPTGTEFPIVYKPYEFDTLAAAISKLLG